SATAPAAPSTSGPASAPSSSWPASAAWRSSPSTAGRAAPAPSSSAIATPASGSPPPPPRPTAPWSWCWWASSTPPPATSRPRPPPRAPRGALGRVERRQLIAYQNCEPIYWSLARRGEIGRVEAVELRPGELCLLNASPVVCQQSFLDYVDAESGDEPLQERA